MHGAKGHGYGKEDFHEYQVELAPLDPFDGKVHVVDLP